MDRTDAGICTSSDRFVKEKQVESILAQMAAVLKNLKTYERSHPILEKSFNLLGLGLFRFLDENESLTLLVREDALIYGNVVVYENTNRLESLAFAFYRDGIRLISFLDSLSQEDLWKFLVALDEAKSANPYEADLVTILWENEISGLRYKAVEAYLDDEEEKAIQELADSCSDNPIEPRPGDLTLGPAFFINELGLSPRGSIEEPSTRLGHITESESSSVVQEIFQEDDHSLMKRCSAICLELAGSAESDEMFNSIVGFLGRICDWLVDRGDLISASSILSELRTMVGEEEDISPRRATVQDTISRLGETKKIERVAAYLADPDKTRLDEVFAYLAMMEPAAVRPLFDILADSEVRDVRYMLCRALSIVARNEPDRLRLFLLDRRWYVVRNAVTILGLIGSAEAIPSLGPATRHNETRVRRECARALGRIKDPATLAILADLAGDEKDVVRLEALQAIGKVGITHARSFIEECIKAKTFEKRTLEEKQEIFKVYGAAGNSSLDLLHAAAKGDIPRLGEKTRVAATQGIATVGTAESLDVLNQLKAGSAGAVASAAAEALSGMDAYRDWMESREH